ncbi:uncharacterized protein SPSK_02703 [Sporothrix schenckii 1099-18]|uniref:Multiple myeloma tumor-associated protein 2-like N-terminal domain-containing protein n=1 Tax=Sporothrix schenckii 1099-18 TaxID=1397361 RepID=A0A0F2MA95_SPOSC|nr:uncharacterized protein SPSK_02703 [Sporothrix schenckii 1099-18]KJR86618.1 hypothetical protein SPSK_02703 [Sporothrix schenckii 1099-18]
MDLVATIRKQGSRGGVNFSWDDVAQSSRREHYLGHSIKAPVGRWQQGRDLTWYAKEGEGQGDDGDEQGGEDGIDAAAAARRDELRRVKEAEEEAMARALGLPPGTRLGGGPGAAVGPAAGTGANSIAVPANTSRMPQPQPETGGEAEIDTTETGTTGVNAATAADGEIIAGMRRRTDVRGTRNTNTIAVRDEAGHVTVMTETTEHLETRETVQMAGRGGLAAGVGVGAVHDVMSRGMIGVAVPETASGGATATTTEETKEEIETENIATNEHSR